jgi:2-amino-4-hydroxy-6-hydroxymethyldihydropteridine diphosphokinase
MSRARHEACLLIGSNIEPERYIPLAAELLRKQLEMERCSPVWETPAVGSDGPNFLNAALLVLTSLDLPALKKQVLHPIEAQLGRVRSQDKNAARTMDIDVIFFDGQLVDAAGLWGYAFRAVPVAAVLPGAVSAEGETLREAAARLARTSPIRLRQDVTIAG